MRNFFVSNISLKSSKLGRITFTSKVGKWSWFPGIINQHRNQFFFYFEGLLHYHCKSRNILQSIKILFIQFQEVSTLVQLNNFVKLEDELLPEFPSRNPSRRGFGDFKRNAGTFGGKKI